ncbi:hypothetical protein Zmor_023818 [Zophobas morio]|uniref:Uncharacterized protein n=1 Tax=Zophobas morio TaxID=2755281 RepID=A0AA38M7M5_9CUCU|nr:hypothetical protein Zmor_023818 [Zophobas morio]
MDFVNSVFDSDSEEAGNHISPEITAAASAAVEELFPVKSKARYEMVYKQFQSWCQKKNVKNVVSESVLLAYFMEKSPFLKRKNDGYKAKKSRVFSKEEFYKFLQEAEDSKYLMIKVAFIFSVADALRRAELTNMSTDDIEDRSDVLVIRVLDTKTKISRTFTIVSGDTEGINLLDVNRKYALLRPPHTGHKLFFVNYTHERCSTQVVGINTIGKIPPLIAEYLDIRYSPELKRLVGWRSTSTAETYAEDSIHNTALRYATGLNLNPREEMFHFASLMYKYFWSTGYGLVDQIKAFPLLAVKHTLLQLGGGSTEI